MGDGEGITGNITSELNNASNVGTPNESDTGLISKIKSKFRLNKNKEKKVIKQKQTSNSNESNNGIGKQTTISNESNNGKQTSISSESNNGKQSSINNGKISISNDGNLTCVSDITQDSSWEGMEEGEVAEYLGEGNHAGKSVVEVDFADGSQKRPLSDSSDDTVNSADFAVPVGPAPRPSKKKPAVVVSMRQSRSVDVGDECSRSRSPVRRSSAGHFPQPAKHKLPSSAAYDPKPKRVPGVASF